MPYYQALSQSALFRRSILKKLKFLSLLLILSILTSCVTIVNPNIRGDNPESDSAAPSESQSTFESTPPSSDSGEASESESQSESSTERDYIESPPDEAADGVYYVASFAELEALASDNAFLFLQNKPLVCISEQFDIEHNIVIHKAADIVYLPTTSLTGASLTFKFDGEYDICVWCADTTPIATGIISVDAPSSHLTVCHGEPPELSAIELYHNVASYNGVKVSGSFGGHGNAAIFDAKLLNIGENASSEALEISVYGNLITLGVPLIVSRNELYDAMLTLTSTTGEAVILNDVDLTSSFPLTLLDESGNARTYLVISERLSYSIPLVEITVDDGASITSKTEYVHATMSIDGVEYQTKIRGRGNSSWTAFPKKSYRIKLDKGAKLFDLPKNRDWVLTCNYTDKTLIRNCVAHDMAKAMSGLDFTSTHILINLYINGEYLGVYTFSDKIEDGNGRLDIGGTTDPDTGELDVGFLLEIGWDFDGQNIYGLDYFDTKTVFRIYVKEPDIEYPNSPEFLYILYYMLNMEKAIMEDGPWEAYIDVDSWIDWMIIQELTFNTESSFYRSCYLWRESGGKVHLGPVWDFDMAFGNHYGDIENYDGWCTTEATYELIFENWMSYLMKSERFTKKLVARWNEVKDELLNVGLNAVTHYSELLTGSQEQNFKRWDIMTKHIGMASVNPYIYNTYEKQVEYLRDFIIMRFNYIDARLNSEEYSSAD